MQSNYPRLRDPTKKFITRKLSTQPTFPSIIRSQIRPLKRNDTDMMEMRAYQMRCNDEKSLAITVHAYRRPIKDIETTATEQYNIILYKNVQHQCSIESNEMSLSARISL